MRTSKTDLFIEYWYIKIRNKPYRLGEHYCNRLGLLFYDRKSLRLVSNDLFAEEMLDAIIKKNNWNCFDLPVKYPFTI